MATRASHTGLVTSGFLSDLSTCRPLDGSVCLVTSSSTSSHEKDDHISSCFFCRSATEGSDADGEGVDSRVNGKALDFKYTGIYVGREKGRIEIHASAPSSSHDGEGVEVAAEEASFGGSIGGGGGAGGRVLEINARIVRRGRDDAGEITYLPQFGDVISLVPLPAPPGMRGQPTIQPVAVLCNPMNAVFVTSVQAGLEKNHETFVLNLPHEGKVTLLASTRHLLITASSNGTVRLYPTDCALLRGKTPAPDARPYRERVASMALEVKEPYFFGFNAHEGSVGSVKGRVGNGETGDCGNGRLVTGGDDGHVRWVIT